MLKLSAEQVEKVVSHIAGFTAILAEAAEIPIELEKRKSKSAMGLGCEELAEVFRIADTCPCEAAPPVPKPSAIFDYEYDDCAKRIEVKSLLCGRWTTKDTRGDIEIERCGEHFILYYLKRNGARTEERYILLWNYGEIYYYCPVNRITVLALHIETDTLMISPGVDYTRVCKSKK
jgi:hypothetical protein